MRHTDMEKELRRFHEAHSCDDCPKGITQVSQERLASKEQLGEVMLRQIAEFPHATMSGEILVESSLEASQGSRRRPAPALRQPAATPRRRQPPPALHMGLASSRSGPPVQR